LILAVIATFCLTATIFMILPSKSSGTYDPWNDVFPIEPDGVINMKDIAWEIANFNTKATDNTTTSTTRKVGIDTYSWNVSMYSLTMAPHSLNNLNITTAGYEHVQLTFNASYLLNPIGVRTGFLLNNSYAGIDTFTVGPASTPSSGHTPNAVFIQAPKTNGTVGEKFNVTIFAYLKDDSVSWQVAIRYPAGTLNLTRIGYTAGNQSDWSTHQTPPNGTITPVGPLLAPGLAIIGEALSQNERVSGVVYTSLCWIEFQTLTPSFETKIELANVGTDTFIVAPDLTLLQFTASNIDWTFYHLIIANQAEKTYTIAGPTLTIETTNPNDFNVTLTIQAYLTTAPNS
jgi:hypothetical protein